MKELDRDLKNRSFKNVYLFYGEESYLKKQYRQSFYNAVVSDASAAFNYTFFEGSSAEPSSIIDACETLPFMNDKRLVEAKDTGLFIQGRKDASESMSKYISNIAESSILIFTEEKIDKRSRLYKEVSKKGCCVEFKRMEENELISFIQSLFENENTKIDTRCALYLLRSVGSDMSSLKKESDKLIAYKNGEDITKEDIDLICTKSLETEIFDLVGAIGSKKADKAIEIYNNLLLLKQSPLMILSMSARQFRLIIQCKYLYSKGLSPDQIGSQIGIRGFMAKNYIRQSANFTNKALLSALKDCLECDVGIKTGKISDRLGVEMIILKYASERINN